jgi:uncharacterized membrane protein
MKTFVKRKASIVESLLSVTLLFLGVYILHVGTADQSPYADAIVVGGAICLALGVTMLILAGRSFRAEHLMARHLRGG